MESSRNNSVVLILIFIGAALAWVNLHSEMAALAGVTLLVVLFAYDQDAQRSSVQSLAFGAVSGMILMVTLYPIKDWLNPTPDPTPGFFTKYLALLIWVCATFATFLLDRARMGARDSFSLRQQQTAVPAMAMAPPVAAAPVAPMPVVNRVEPKREPIAAVPPIAPPVIEREPLAAVSAVESRPPIETTIGTAYGAAPAPQAVPQSAVQTAPLPTGGKPVTIYVNLVGEGMNIMRQIQAEHVGRDYYMITEQMPANENWEFRTGQVVRCRKKNLSNGKGLVAYEEAPRAQ